MPQNHEVKAGKEPGGHWGKRAAIAGTILGGLTLLALVTALLIPDLVRRDLSFNEATAIADIRTVISAEAAYQSANAGYYDTLGCLGAPSTCIPGYSGAVFVGAELASGAAKSGYKRTLHPGAPASAPAGADKRSPSSMMSFAYTAIPVNRNTGVRSFCGDSSGGVSQTLGDPNESLVVNGQCAGRLLR